MNEPFYLKRGDRRPPLEALLTDAAGAAVNLATATAVRYSMRATLDRRAVVASQDAQVVTPAEGLVRYSWQAGETDVAGQYLGEFEVQWGDETLQTFPNDRDIVVEIRDDLG